MDTHLVEPDWTLSTKACDDVRVKDVVLSSLASRLLSNICISSLAELLNLGCKGYDGVPKIEARQACR